MTQHFVAAVLLAFSLEFTSSLQVSPQHFQAAPQTPTDAYAGVGRSGSSRRRRRSVAVDFRGALTVPGPLGSSSAHVFLASPAALSSVREEAPAPLDEQQPPGPPTFFQVTAEIGEINASLSDDVVEPVVGDFTMAQVDHIGIVHDWQDQQQEVREEDQEQVVDDGASGWNASTIGVNSLAELQASTDSAPDLGELAAASAAVGADDLGLAVGNTSWGDAVEQPAEVSLALESLPRGTAIGAASSPDAAKDMMLPERAVPLTRSSLFAELEFWLAMLVFVVAVASTAWRHRPTAGGLSGAVAKLPLATSVEIQAALGGGSGKTSSLGAPIRLEGRIRSKPGGCLTAPFSGRRCVSYSSSVSRSRHDSIHSPPLAYHTASSDFVLELSGAPEVSLVVHSHDVALFGMGQGLHSREHAFPAAPEPWQSFVLAHLVPAADASTHFGACVDLSSDGASLEFRECALLEGSLVTCAGEVTRDCTGALSLQPWRPESGDAEGKKRRNGLHWVVEAAPRLATALSRGGQRPPGGGGGGGVQHEGLVGRVMVSDDANLLGNVTTGRWWTR